MYLEVLKVFKSNFIKILNYNFTLSWFKYFDQKNYTMFILKMFQYIRPKYLQGANVSIPSNCILLKAFERLMMKFLPWPNLQKLIKFLPTKVSTLKSRWYAITFRWFIDFVKFPKKQCGGLSLLPAVSRLLLNKVKNPL